MENMAQSKLVMLSSGMSDRDVLLNEVLLDAYGVWCNTGFKCMNVVALFHHSYKVLLGELLVIGNEPELSTKFIQRMITQFCVANWPNFTTMRDAMIKKNETLTAANFLKTYAKTMAVCSNSILLWSDPSSKKKSLKKKSQENLVGDPYKKVRSLPIF